MLATLINQVNETVAKPGLLGVVGKSIEKRCLSGMQGYFDILNSRVQQALDFGQLASMPADQARHLADLKTATVVRLLTPMLRETLIGYIKMAYHTASGLTIAVTPVKEAAVKSGAKKLDMLGETGIDAAEYAEREAAELVTGINNTTRKRVADAVAEGITDQLGVGGLGRLIRETMEDIGVGRAQMIATTEMNNAMSEATLKKMKRIGIKYKQIILAPDPCPICEENAEEDPLPVTEEYSSGDLRPPFHPNCRCAIAGAPPPESETGEDDESD